ncbi:MAG: hypothetical protein RXR51_08885 [Nitrososphaeria archaeon]
MMTQTRNRTPIALILYALLYLYFSSLRRAALEPIIKRSNMKIDSKVFVHTRF